MSSAWRNALEDIIHSTEQNLLYGRDGTSFHLSPKQHEDSILSHTASPAVNTSAQRMFDLNTDLSSLSTPHKGIGSDNRAGVASAFGYDPIAPTSHHDIGSGLDTSLNTSEHAHTLGGSELLALRRENINAQITAIRAEIRDFQGTMKREYELQSDLHVKQKESLRRELLTELENVRGKIELQREPHQQLQKQVDGLSRDCAETTSRITVVEENLQRLQHADTRARSSIPADIESKIKMNQQGVEVEIEQVRSQLEKMEHKLNQTDAVVAETKTLYIAQESSSSFFQESIDRLSNRMTALSSELAEERNQRVALEREMDGAYRRALGGDDSNTGGPHDPATVTTVTLLQEQCQDLQQQLEASLQARHSMEEEISQIKKLLTVQDISMQTAESEHQQLKKVTLSLASRVAQLIKNGQKQEEEQAAEKEDEKGSGDPDNGEGEDQAEGSSVVLSELAGRVTFIEEYLTKKEEEEEEQKSVAQDNQGRHDDDHGDDDHHHHHQDPPRTPTKRSHAAVREATNARLDALERAVHEKLEQAASANPASPAARLLENGENDDTIQQQVHDLAIQLSQMQKQLQSRNDRPSDIGESYDAQMKDLGDNLSKYINDQVEALAEQVGEINDMLLTVRSRVNGLDDRVDEVTAGLEAVGSDHENLVATDTDLTHRVEVVESELQDQLHTISSLNSSLPGVIEEAKTSLRTEMRAAVSAAFDEHYGPASPGADAHDSPVRAAAVSSATVDALSDRVDRLAHELGDLLGRDLDDSRAVVDERSRQLVRESDLRQLLEEQQSRFQAHIANIEEALESKAEAGAVGSSPIPYSATPTSQRGDTGEQAQESTASLPGHVIRRIDTLEAIVDDLTGERADAESKWREWAESQFEYIDHALSLASQEQKAFYKELRTELCKGSATADGATIDDASIVGIREEMRASLELVDRNFETFQSALFTELERHRSEDLVVLSNIIATIEEQAVSILDESERKAEEQQRHHEATLERAQAEARAQALHQAQLRSQEEADQRQRAAEQERMKKQEEASALNQAQPQQQPVTQGQYEPWNDEEDEDEDEDESPVHRSVIILKESDDDDDHDHDHDGQRQYGPATRSPATTRIAVRDTISQQELTISDDGDMSDGDSAGTDDLLACLE